MPPSGKSVRCAARLVSRPRKPTVTPAAIQASRPSSVAFAEEWNMWATSAAHTVPTARQTGTAALDGLPPAPMATNGATRAVTAHAPTRRRVTETDGRAVSRGDIECLQTDARWTLISNAGP